MQPTFYRMTAYVTFADEDAVASTEIQHSITFNLPWANDNLARKCCHNFGIIYINMHSMN